MLPPESCDQLIDDSKHGPDGELCGLKYRTSVGIQQKGQVVYANLAFPRQSLKNPPIPNIFHHVFRPHTPVQYFPHSFEKIAICSI